MATRSRIRRLILITGTTLCVLIAAAFGVSLDSVSIVGGGLASPSAWVS